MDLVNNIKEKRIKANIRLLAKNISSCCGGDYIIGVTHDEDIIVKGYTKNFVHANGFEQSSDFILITNPHKEVKIKEIITASRDIYVLYEDGELYVMGYNKYGSLGIGSTTSQWFLVHSASEVKKIIASNIGYYIDDVFAFILKNNNKVYATGRNFTGNLGLGNNIDKSWWTKVPFLDNIEEIKDIVCAGAYKASSYILTTNGEVLSTGYNEYGSLGLNDTDDRNTFTKITALKNTKIEKIIVSSGWGTNKIDTDFSISVLALSTNKQLFAWGGNARFQLGIADDSQKNSPVMVLVNLEDDEIIEELYSPCEKSNFYFKTSKGNLYGSGNNFYGQLNKEYVSSYNVFTKILENVKDVHITKSACGGWMVGVYVITKDDELVVFGYNDMGVLGTSSVGSIKEALKLAFEHTEDIKQIYSTGNYWLSVYVLLKDGRVYGCGNNKSVQIQNSQEEAIKKLIRVF